MFVLLAHHVGKSSHTLEKGVTTHVRKTHESNAHLGEILTERTCCRDPHLRRERARSQASQGPLLPMPGDQAPELTSVWTGAADYFAVPPTPPERCEAVQVFRSLAQHCL